MMDIRIVDRGRGPEITGSRITVYDVLDYTDEHPPEFIAGLFDLDIEQVLAALRYIDKNRDAVMAEYRAMLDRGGQGHSPAVQARLDEARRRFTMLRDVRDRDPIRYQAIVAARRESHDAYLKLLLSHHSELAKEAPLARAPR